MCSQAENRWAKVVVLKLEPSAEPPGGLIQKADSRAPPSFRFRCAFLTRSQVMLGILIWGHDFEDHRVTASMGPGPSHLHSFHK